LDAELDNLRAALACWAELGPSLDGIRLVGHLWPYWIHRGLWTEGRAWLEQAAGWSAGTHSGERVRVLNGAAALAIFQGDEPSGVAHAREALRIAQEIGDALGAAHARFGLGLAASSRQDYAQATGHYEAAVAVLRDLGPAVASAAPLLGVLLENLGSVALARGDDARAERLGEDVLSTQRKLGFTWGAADSLGLLAAIAHRRGDAGRALAFYRQRLDLAQQHRGVHQFGEPLDGVAIIAAAASQDEPAARLFGAAARLDELLGRPPATGGHAERDRAIATVRARLGDDAFWAAWAAGQRLRPEEAIAEVARVEVAVTATGPSAGAEPAARHGLTPRERDVLRLLVEGRSNAQIAEILFVGVRTVRGHVASILAKLDVPTRTAAATYAVRHELI
jgi:non-specific serine/threonine protein kinase